MVKQKFVCEKCTNRYFCLTNGLVCLTRGRVRPKESYVACLDHINSLPEAVGDPECTGLKEEVEMKVSRMI